MQNLTQVVPQLSEPQVSSHSDYPNCSIEVFAESVRLIRVFE